MIQSIFLTVLHPYVSNGWPHQQDPQKYMRSFLGYVLLAIDSAYRRSTNNTWFHAVIAAPQATSDEPLRSDNNIFIKMAPVNSVQVFGK